MSVPRPSPQSPLKPTLRPDVAVRFGKPLVFLLCLTPLALLVWRALSDGLGANPVEAIVHFTGSWALRLLLVTLAVTPLRRLSGLPWLVRFRRQLGLFAFFYAVLHFAAYLVLDRALVWEDITTDLTKRPYIVVGFVALLLLVPLAITSTRGWIKRLGRHWVTLHRTVYVIAILAVLHFLWLVKADTLEPLIDAALLAVLLAFRVPWGRLVGRRGP
ncbi:MAG: sulfoxide reductase heme-binding subunit YedZ [Chromatiaceae bacterium]|nr:sulfoxide reductase heme-binding subunit YedZ [Chromatiaceae bacterium]